MNKAVICSVNIGIAGILCWADPEAFEGNGASFPQEVMIIGFNDLYRCRPENSDCPGNKSNWVKPIAGVCTSPCAAQAGRMYLAEMPIYSHVRKA